MKNYLIIFFTFVVILLVYTPEIFAQWINTGGPGGGFITALIVKGNKLFAGTYSGGIYLSTNNGTDWNAVNSGLPKGDVRAFAIIKNNIFVGTSNGLYISTNNGMMWNPADSGIRNNDILSLIASDTNLYAGIGGGGVCLSTNEGSSWTDISSDLPIYQIYTTKIYPLVNTLAVVGTNLFIGTQYHGVFLSTDNGSSWSEVNNGLTDLYIYSFASIDTNVFVGNSIGEVFLWNNNNRKWNAVDSVLKETDSRVHLVAKNNDLYAGTWGVYNKIFKSANYGANWIEVDSGFPQINIRSITLNDTFLFVGTDNYVFRRPLNEMITTVKQNSAQLPEDIFLNQNYPNPFNPITTIEFSIPKRLFVTLKVYDYLGRKVTTLVDEEKHAGTYKVKFNGILLSSGIYFYCLQCGKYSKTKKLILIK